MMQDFNQWNLERADLDAWQDKPTKDLVRHIMERYHRETRNGIALLENLSEEAALFEGWRTPVLMAIRDEVDLFATEMRLHLKMEESTLFPAILAREDGREVDTQMELMEPLDLFEDEHQAAEGLLLRIRTLTEGFTPPPGCQPIQAELYAACRTLAESLMRHIYLENQVLFPRLM